MEPRLLPHTDLAVIRGHDVAKYIADETRNHQSKGRECLSITINRQAADAMKAYFYSFTQFDGVLPNHCHGIPLLIDLTARENVTIRFRERETVN